MYDAYDSLEKKTQFVALCLDFSKAFDTINHEILIRKLDHVGVRGIAGQWFASYLANRSQYVRLRGTSSSVKSLRTGVPQGSVLGPLLFIIYINDMSKVCPDLKCIHYADDTTVYSSCADVHRLTDSLQVGLDRLDGWYRANRLLLNVSKTSCILISNSLCAADVPGIILNGDPVGFVDCCKLLGVFIDKDLKFKCHTDTVCKRLSRSTGLLRKVQLYLPDFVVARLYFSLFQSHLAYALLAWGKLKYFEC